MRSRWTALLGVLVFAGLTPRSSQAQAPPQTPPRQSARGGLEQNTPNPMNPETWIKFTVGDYPTCTNSSLRHAVSLTIYNTLGQRYAIPVLLQAGTASVAGGQPLSKLPLACGSYQAYWNGKIIGSQKEAASGVYQYHLEIDGRIIGARKMLVIK